MRACSLAALRDLERRCHLQLLGRSGNFSLRLRPVSCPTVGQLIVMGGAEREGNVTPTAEYNFHCDPESAHVVFRKFREVLLVRWAARPRCSCRSESRAGSRQGGRAASRGTWGPALDGMQTRRRRLRLPGCAPPCTPLPTSWQGSACVVMHHAQHAAIFSFRRVLHDSSHTPICHTQLGVHAAAHAARAMGGRLAGQAHRQGALHGGGHGQVAGL